MLLCSIWVIQVRNGIENLQVSIHLDLLKQHSNHLLNHLRSTVHSKLHLLLHSHCTAPLTMRQLAYMRCMTLCLTSVNYCAISIFRPWQEWILVPVQKYAWKVIVQTMSPEPCWYTTKVTLSKDTEKKKTVHCWTW